SKEMRTLFPKATIYSFEPLADCFTILTKTMKDDSHFTAYNFALGDVSGETIIEHSSFHPSSSLLPMAKLHKELYPKSAQSEKETIQVHTLDSLQPALPIDGPTLIKLDVQGFE